MYQLAGTLPCTYPLNFSNQIMSIQIRYFASLRDTVNCPEQQVAADNVVTVKDVWTKANPDQELPENILAAINMDYAPMDAPVSDGDEVAFFPPVTGG